jgi:hypothetical protein
MALQILMNGELDEAMAILGERSFDSIDAQSDRANIPPSISSSNMHWRWRLQSVERIAELMDPVRFGVKALYLFGSTQNATAGPKSDIDLLIHFTGTSAQEEDLRLWLEGWSLCLSHVNYLKTGYKTDGLLSIHLITDQDIKKKTSYAVKIGTISDPALFIPLGKQPAV